jgi:antitoxin HicB
MEVAPEMKTVPRFEIRPLSEVEGEGNLVEFPDFPGCVADGETPEQALEEGIDALDSYRKTLEELGRTVPAAGEVYRGESRQRVPTSSA